MKIFKRIQDHISTPKLVWLIAEMGHIDDATYTGEVDKDIFPVCADLGIDGKAIVKQVQKEAKENQKAETLKKKSK